MVSLPSLQSPGLGFLKTISTMGIAAVLVRLVLMVVFHGEI